MHQRNLDAASEGKFKPKPLIADQFYVIKVVETANLPQYLQDEALQEMIQHAKLDNPFIVGYFDSFIDDNNVFNMVLEFCHHGNLCEYIKK